VRKAKRILVAMAGGTVLAIGMAQVVLPGPAFLVIPAGLAILAAEFGWAQRWLCKARALLPKKAPTGRRGEGRKQSDARRIQTIVKANRDGNPGSHGPYRPQVGLAVVAGPAACAAVGMSPGRDRHSRIQAAAKRSYPMNPPFS
jgi:tellurite resistance protein TerC